MPHGTSDSEKDLHTTNVEPQSVYFMAPRPHQRAMLPARPTELDNGHHRADSKLEFLKPFCHKPSAARTCNTLPSVGMKSAALFDAMSAAVKTKGPELVKMGGAVFQFIISDGGADGKFVLDLKNGSGSAKKGEDTADCTITMKDDDFMAMAEGKLDGMQAFMGGKLKIKGNMMLAQKLQSILEAAR